MTLRLVLESTRGGESRDAVTARGIDAHSARRTRIVASTHAVYLHRGAT